MANCDAFSGESRVWQKLFDFLQGIPRPSGSLVIDLRTLCLLVHGRHSLTFCYHRYFVLRAQQSAGFVCELDSSNHLSSSLWKSFSLLMRPIVSIIRGQNHVFNIFKLKSAIQCLRCNKNSPLARVSVVRLPSARNWLVSPIISILRYLSHGTLAYNYET